MFHAELKDYLYNNSPIVTKTYNFCWGHFIGKIICLIRREILDFNIAVKEMGFKATLRIFPLAMCLGYV